MANASRPRYRKENAAKPGLYRIGMFSESFHPVQNGVTTSVLILIDCLRARGHHVCMFAPAHERQPEQEPHVLRFPSFVSAFNREYPLAYPFYPRLALETHFDRLRLDVVHTHTPFVMGLTGAKLALRRGVPLVSTFHTLYSQYTHYVPLLPDMVTQSLLEHYLPWYYNRCAEIICPSEVAARVLREQGIERPIQIIPTGIPLPPPDVLTQESRRAARQRIGVPFDTPLMLFAGRLAREKNLDWLLSVFGRVRERVPTVRLAIAGGGPYTEELKALAAQFDEDVLFLGPTPRQELDALFAACDVFVFPSPSETQGLVIGEARAAGAPCVVVDAGGAPETVSEGEDGFRVPVDDDEGFAARVVQILTDRPLAATLRAHARRNALRYTPERMVNSVLAVYTRAKSEAAVLAPQLNVSLRAHSADVDVDWETLGQSVVEKFDEKFEKLEER
jgi:1,2-diacylglycerol 3-alpha-glucosyltransferase